MSQIITGTGLGINGSSCSQLGSYGPNGSAALGLGGISMYVNVATGNLVVREQDGFVVGSGLGFAWQSTYNSRQNGWNLSVQSCLQLTGEINTNDSFVTRIDEDGHQSIFHYNNSNGCYLADDGSKASLVFKNNTWFYNNGAGDAFAQYNAAGRLNTWSDKNGHYWQFNYDTNGQLSNITDNSGKQHIDWEIVDGRLKSISVYSDGEQIEHLSYEYDHLGRLTRVQREDDKHSIFWVVYDYEGDTSLLSGIRQSDGINASFTYDAEGRLVSLTDGDGRITRYHYEKGQTIVTNAAGESWTYRYDENGHLIQITGPSGYATDYDYKDNRLVGVTQGTLHWQLDYNEAGDCIWMKNPAGEEIRRSYDDQHHLLSETTEVAGKTLHTQHWAYDGQGHLLFYIAANGTVTEYRYDSAGLCINKLTYLAAGWTGENNPDLTGLSAWAAKQPLSLVKLISFRYDWRGQLIEETDYAAVDNAGNGIRAGAISCFYHYDAEGRLLEKSKTLSDGRIARTSYLYDVIGRPVLKTDSEGHTERYEYDDANQRVIFTDARGLQTLTIYDHAGHTLTQQTISTGRLLGTSFSSYDVAGRLLETIAPDGTRSHYFYTQSGKLAGKMVAGKLTEYRYDDYDRLVETIDYAAFINATLQANITSLAAIRPESSSRDRCNYTLYNQANQLAYTVNASGTVIQYVYDGEGLLVEQIAYSTRLTYLSQPLTCEQLQQLPINAHDRHQYNYYDEENRLIGHIGGDGETTFYHYNRAGFLIDTCQAGNRATKPVRGDWSASKPLSSNNDRHHYSLYDGAGLKIADLDSTGVVTTYSYNEQGLLTQKHSWYSPLILPSDPTEQNLIAALKTLQTTNNDRVVNYKYTSNGLLKEESYSNGLITRYSYDAGGLVLEATHLDSKTAAVRSERFRYDAKGQLIARLDGAGASLLANSSLSEESVEKIWQTHSIHYSYDEAGRIVSKNSGQHLREQYIYDEQGLLRYTVNGAGEISENHYNAFGNLMMVHHYSLRLPLTHSLLTKENIASQLINLATDIDEFTYYDYNESGQITNTRKGSNDKTTVIYNAFGEIEQTQTNKRIENYSYDNAGHLLNKSWGDSQARTSLGFIYDTFGEVITEINGLGAETKYHYNLRGERDVIINAQGIGQFLSYDAYGRLITEKDWTGRTKAIYAYRDTDNTLTVAYPLTNSVVETHFNAFGDKVLFRDARGNETTYNYNSRGELTNITAPEGRTHHYDYDAQGNLVFETSNNQRSIRYTYDAMGRVLTTTVDPDGLAIKTITTYDGIGRTLTTTNASGVITQFSYDQSGNLISTIKDPAGIAITTRFKYDNAGNLVLKTDKNPAGVDRATSYSWDALGRCISQTQDPDGLAITTAYEYDAVGNLIAQTDPLGYRKTWVYDLLNRCNYSIDARGVVTKHQYDNNNHEIHTIVYSERIKTTNTLLTEDDLNGLVTTSDKDLHSFRQVDAAGRVTLMVDGEGYATAFEYDQNDNVIKRTRYAERLDRNACLVGNFTYSDVESRSNLYAYNAANEVIYEMDSNHVVCGYSYNAQGECIAKTRFQKPLGNITNFDADHLQTLLISNPANDSIVCFAYDAAGRLKAELNAVGAVKCYQYDALGRLIRTTSLALPLALADRLNPDWIDCVSTHNTDRSQRTVYDSVGNELYRISGQGRVMARTHDALGQVLSENAYDGFIKIDGLAEESIEKTLTTFTQKHTSSYQYDALGRLHIKSDALMHDTVYDYDKNNNLKSQTDALGNTWYFTYDETGHCITRSSPPVKVTAEVDGVWQHVIRPIVTKNTYDSFGNLIKVVTDTKGLQRTLNYTYDFNNHCISNSHNAWVNDAANQVLADRQEKLITVTELYRYSSSRHRIDSTAAVHSNYSIS